MEHLAVLFVFDLGEVGLVVLVVVDGAAEEALEGDLLEVGGVEAALFSDERL